MAPSFLSAFLHLTLAGDSPATLRPKLTSKLQGNCCPNFGTVFALHSAQRVSTPVPAIARWSIAAASGDNRCSPPEARSASVPQMATPSSNDHRKNIAGAPVSRGISGGPFSAGCSGQFSVAPHQEGSILQPLFVQGTLPTRHRLISPTAKPPAHSYNATASNRVHPV